MTTSSRVIRGALGALASTLGPLALALQRRREAGIVLLYHRVGRETDDTYAPLSPEEFHAHCTFVRHHYTVVPLGELVARHARGASLQGLCAITFDDGYKDFVTHAVPILADFDFPVTHFLVSSCVKDGRPPWTYRARRAATYLGRALGDVSDVTRDVEALGAVERERRLEEHDVPGALPRMLDVDDVGRLGSRVEWASHTKTHAFLDRISDDELRAELAGAKEDLEELTGAPVRYLAYPNGIWNARAAELARECGYDAAFAVGQDELRLHSPPFALPRFDVGSIPSTMLPLEATGFVQKLRDARSTVRRIT